MMNSCIFAVWHRSDASGDAITTRLHHLERLYRPLEAGAATLRKAARATVSLGSIPFGRGSAGVGSSTLLWGGTLPPDLAAEPGLLAATDVELRALCGSVAAIAADDDRALIVTGAGPPTTLYVARSPGVTAWSSHAVAAAYLAHGEARIDRAAIPELLATRLVGGGRCLIEGVEPVPPATAVEVTSAGQRSRSYWPARERWRLVPENEAQEIAAEALTATLVQRLAGFDTIGLGLTAGLDSRVAAVVLKEAGVRFRSFTWGTEGAEVDGARSVAQTLEVEHSVLGYELWPDQEALTRVRESALWHEGAVHIGFGRPPAPVGVDAHLMGGGGEVGRAFYYPGSASAAFRSPTPPQCVRLLDRLFAPRIASASTTAQTALRRGLERWVAAAEASGASGWRLLDVVYCEQRMQCWGRAMLPRQSQPLVHAFASPDVMRALCSLPLSERLTDGFHRRFLSSRDPRLMPPPPPECPEYQPVGAALQRLQYQAATASARRAFWRIVRGRSLRRPGDIASGGSHPWATRPQLRDWIANDVLGGDLLAEAMGERWAADVRARFLAGEANAEGTATLAAGPVALDSAVGSLPAAG